MPPSPRGNRVNLSQAADDDGDDGDDGDDDADDEQSPAPTPILMGTV